MDQIVGFISTCRHESGSQASEPGIGLRALRIYRQRRGHLRPRGRTPALMLAPLVGVPGHNLRRAVQAGAPGQWPDLEHLR
jgi:hypothetical protein